MYRRIMRRVGGKKFFSVKVPCYCAVCWRADSEGVFSANAVSNMSTSCRQRMAFPIREAIAVSCFALSEAPEANPIERVLGYLVFAWRAGKHGHLPRHHC